MSATECATPQLLFRARLLSLAVILLLAAWSQGVMAAPADDTDFSSIKKSFESAAKVKLGTYQDMREIVAAIKRDDPDMTVIEIRWFSSDAVIVKTIWHEGTPKVGTYFYILKNESTGWRISERDLYSVL